MFGFTLSEIFKPKVKNMIIHPEEQKRAANLSELPPKLNIQKLIEGPRGEEPFNESVKSYVKDEQNMKIHSVYSFFMESLKTLSLNAKSLESKTEEVQILWNQLIQSHIGRNYFNFDYLYQTLNVFRQYCKSKDSITDDYVVLGIILQRVLGINESCSKNADFAGRYLNEKIGIFNFHADRVREIIMSARSVEFHGDLKKQYFHDLQLARLGTDYISFVFTQRQLLTENPHLTSKEFFSCQKAIFEQILKNSYIYQILWFRDKFEVQAKDNIKKYLECVDNKLSNILSDEKKSLVKKKNLELGCVTKV